MSTCSRVDEVTCVNLRAGLLDLAGPFVRGNRRGVGNRTLGDQRVERSRIDGGALRMD